MKLLAIAGVAFFGWWLAMPIFFGILRAFGVYIVVHERRAHVYTLFGKVVGVFDQPGMYSMWPKLGAQLAAQPMPQRTVQS